MIGRTLSHYSIVEELGRGGMGEVYRARDEVLGRQVAIKVLPEAFTQDPERLARFEREAKVLASLNHPHIGAIYGLEQDDDQRFLVLELVGGETLGEHLVLDPMPVEEAVPIAIQIAQALEAAHEKGVVHRDLKPANIKITPEGDVKVLDFGLAKPTEAVFEGNLTESPTLTYAPTGVGVILGTAAYMSPEQVRGQEVDKRSDIWAFGVVLWEMLTGKKLFQGNTVSDVLASTLMREPDWAGLPPALPGAVTRVLKRCLVQDPKARLHDIADARIELQEALDESEEQPRAAAASRPVLLRALPWLVVPAALIVGWLLKPEQKPEPALTVRFEVRVPEGEQIVHGFRHSIALSPNGQDLAFVSGTFSDDFFQQEHQIYLRRFDQWQARPVMGSEMGFQPVFSPDGNWLAFVTEPPAQLRKVPVDGGQAQTLCDCEAFFGITWGPDGTIVFAGEVGPLQQVSTAGGQPAPLTDLREVDGETGHRLPHFLPDGSAVIFTSVYSYRDWEQSQIVAYSLLSGERKLLVQGGSDGQYLDSGHLIFAREGKLFAVRFDPVKLETAGPAIPVLEGINHSIYSFASFFRTGAANSSLSTSGSIAYLAGSVYPEMRSRIVFVGQDGEEVEIPGLDQKQYLSARLSPDGRRTLLTVNYHPENVWLFDLDRGTLTRETFEGRQNWAIWGPGPDEFTFGSYQDGVWSVNTKELGSGPGARQELLGDSREIRLSSWSPDGRHLAFVSPSRYNDSSTNDIWILSSEGELAPFIESDFWTGYPEFSPNGHWMAYTSSESGREEVYVRPFPGPGPAVQISTNGGKASAWSRDGGEIFYRTDDGEFIAVEIESAGDRLSVGRPQILFAGGYGWAGPVRSYDVTADGRFLLHTGPVAEAIQAIGEFFPDRIQVVQNWAEEVRRKVPARR